MALIISTEPEIRIPVRPTPYVVPDSTQTSNTNGQSTSDKTSNQVNITANSNSITISSIVNTAPFNEYTKSIRKNTAGDTLIDVKYSSPEVYSSLFTTRNGFYQRYSNTNKEGKLNSGLINGDIKYDTGYVTGYGNYLWSRIPYYAVIPNCIGGARARYAELVNGKSGTDPLPILGVTPAYLDNTTPFNKTPDTEVVKGLKLGKDTSGTYGVKDGLGGHYKLNETLPVLPGCMLVWYNPKVGKSDSHIVFVEAVYNYGTENEYVITTESAYGHYDSLALRAYKVGKYGANGRNYGPYYYTSRYRNTEVFYTPLCNISPSLGNTVVPITINHQDPPEEQVEAYEQIKQIIAQSQRALVAGNKVQIEAIGNMKSDGSGKKVNRLLGQGGVKKVHDSGLDYPYEVMDKKSGGSLIGFFSRSGLKFLE